MSLQYLLDGYNIIQQSPVLSERKLKDGREKLVRLIEAHRPQGSCNNSVTIVFDGRSGMISQQKSVTVKTIFSQGESADEKIKRIVDASKNKKRIVVVTDDKEIRFYVRALGASPISVKEFLKKIHLTSEKSRRNIERKSSKSQGIKQISKSVECKITEELMEVWLKRHNHKKQ